MNKEKYSFVQQIYIDAIEKYKSENYGELPTVRKLAELVGVSSSGTVGGMLNRLKKKGYKMKEGK